jgi:hypothetical protein
MRFAMSRSLFAVAALGLTLALSACETQDPEETEAKAAKAPLPELHAPTAPDDKLWQPYLQQVIGRNQAGVTDRTMAYYLPNDSDTASPEDSDGKTKYVRQAENVNAVVQRTVLPGNMLAFGSPNSTRMADLIVASFAGGEPDALKGSQVLFIGQAADNERVKAAVEAVGGKYIFVEAK